MMSSGSPVLYHLSDDVPELRIRLVVGPSGSVEHMTYDFREDVREFSGSEISSLVTPESIRATVVLDPGGDTVSMVSLELILPVVVFGPEVPEEGPFGVFAAGLRIERFPTSSRVIPGPQQSFEAITLTGRAIAHHPEARDDAATG